MPEFPIDSPKSSLDTIDHRLDGSSERAFWTFHAAGRLYGIDVSVMREVSTNTVVTPVPHAPPAIRGLANLRSRILMVIDLRPILGLPSAELTRDSRLAILKPSIIEDAGILVDRGGDIVRVSKDRIESAESSAQGVSGDRRSIVSGVCKLEHELMMIVDARRMTDIIAEGMR